MSPAEISATLNEKGEFDLNNHGVILTLISWLGPTFFIVAIRVR